MFSFASRWIFLALLLVSSSSGADYLYKGDPESEGIVVEYITSEPNGDALSSVPSSKIRVVEFYHPRCSHCRHFKPHYVKVATELTKDHPADVEFHAVSCLAHTDICKMFNLTVYPSLFVVPRNFVWTKAVPLSRTAFKWDAIQAAAANSSPSILEKRQLVTAKTAAKEGVKTDIQEKKQVAKEAENVETKENSKVDKQGNGNDKQENKELDKQANGKDKQENKELDKQANGKDEQEDKELDKLANGKDEQENRKDDNSENKEKTTDDKKNDNIVNKENKNDHQKADNTANEKKDVNLEIKEEKKLEKLADSTKNQEKKKLEKQLENIDNDKKMLQKQVSDTETQGNKKKLLVKKPAKEDSPEVDTQQAALVAAVPSPSKIVQKSNAADFADQKEADEDITMGATVISVRDKIKKTIKEQDDSTENSLVQNKKIALANPKAPLTLKSQASKQKNEEVILDKKQSIPARQIVRKDKTVDEAPNDDKLDSEDQTDDGVKSQEDTLINEADIAFAEAENTEESGDVNSEDQDVDSVENIDSEIQDGDDAVSDQIPDDREDSSDVTDRDVADLDDSGDIPTKPRPGAALAQTKRKEADKYVVELKKKIKQQESWLKVKDKLLRLKNSPTTVAADEGATPVMKANQVTTDEFRERQRRYVEFLKKQQRKHKSVQVDPAVQKGTIGKLAYAKDVSRIRLVEKLPVVKRVIRMSEEEELILDCSMAIMHGLRFNLMKTRNPLNPTEKGVLARWLDLLNVALPPEWGIQSLIYDLRKNIDFASENYANLEQILSRYPVARKGWSNSCIQGGLSCGYWKLFHVISVGVAEHRGGLNLIDAGMREATTETFSPAEAADTLRDYIENFFYCKECAEHFLEDYADCDRNRRCDRLSPAMRTASDQDWKEMALWLWEYHNDLSVELLHAAADSKRKQHVFLLGRPPVGPGMAPVAQAIQVLWPTLDECAPCLNFDGTWNEAAVFRHLERTYWPGFDLDFNKINRRLVRFGGEEMSSSRLTIILGVALVILFAYMRWSLSSSAFQRTLLLARRIGPKVSAGTKERSA